MQKVSIKQQHGVVLFIALVALLAMMISSIALVRAVDTTTIVAGNIAFRQSTALSADSGIKAGYDWLDARRGSITLYNTQTDSGYISNIPSAEPDWTAESTWQNAVTVGTDAAGNRVQYIIHRACTNANMAPYRNNVAGAPNPCFTTQSIKSDISNVALSNEGDTSGFADPGKDDFYYRITARVIGPRNTVTITQAEVIL